MGTPLDKPRPRPLVIAHRGASGYLPEHTLAGKALAYGFGADFLEQDVVATRDGHLVVLHDLVLDDVSNVAEVFAGRARTDGHYYVFDFDLDELRSLELHERRLPGSDELRFGGRFAGRSTSFRVATLAEEIELVGSLNRATGRNVGIYPEIKHPAWHRQAGIDLGRALLDVLSAHGYASRGDAVYVQCFDATELKRLRDQAGTPLELIQLLDRDALADGRGRGERLEAIAAYAAGVGMPYEDLLAVDGATLRPSALVAEVRRAGLELHPYTFRRDAMADLPGIDFVRLLQFFMTEVGVEALFCDQPDVVLEVRERTVGYSA